MSWLRYQTSGNHALLKLQNAATLQAKTGQGVTCVRTQPLAASSMPQEEVPLRLSFGPLDACSRELGVLSVLSSKACHSRSSSCVSGSSTFSRLSTAAESALYSCNENWLPQKAVMWGCVVRMCVQVPEGEGFCTAMPKCCTTALRNERALLYKLFRTSLHNTSFQLLNMGSMRHAATELCWLSVSRSMLSSARLPQQSRKAQSAGLVAQL